MTTVNAIKPQIFSKCDNAIVSYGSVSGFINLVCGFMRHMHVARGTWHVTHDSGTWLA